MLRSSLRAAALSLSLSGGVARGRRAASGSSRQLLAALIERIPLVTPELPAWKTDSLRRQQKICTSLAKVYPTEFTTAEEGPDRKQARLRAAAIITDEASREGAADANADETSTDRKLAHRLYLVLRNGDSWSLPRVEWTPDSPPVVESLGGHVAATCGEDMKFHWMGNAPIAHFPQGDLTTFYWRLQLISGDVVLGDGLDGFAWLTKQELAERLGGPEGELALEMCGPFD